MIRHLFLTTLAASVVLCIGFADNTSSKVVIPVNKTSATNGKQMFASYCAPCHGADGKGQGPVSPALRVQPTNLTYLARNNHGKFPDAHILAVLEFGSDVPAHGSAEMPVWGPLLGKMSMANPQEKQLRISNLSRYIESIQAK
jgi:Cytochrome C oxidase, cbb3-type, subunit III